MVKIIQMSAVRRETEHGDVEPIVFGIGENGGIYQWDPTKSEWSFWGNNAQKSSYWPEQTSEEKGTASVHYPIY